MRNAGARAAEQTASTPREQWSGRPRRAAPAAGAWTAIVLLGVLGTVARGWAQSGVQIVVDSTSAAPVPVDTTAPIEQPITGHALPCENGHIAIYDCSHVELLSYLPRRFLGGAGGYDLWGWTDSTTGREFVFIGGGHGTAFVEVTDPVNPRYLGFLALPGGGTGIPGIKVYQHYAFIAAEAMNAGVQVFDLTQLRDIKAPPVTFHETAHYDQVTNSHTLTLDASSGFAYAAGSLLPGGETCGASLHAIDVRVPTKPTFAGCILADPSLGFPIPGYVHDSQCVVYHGPDGQYQGREICLYSAGGGLGIVDVTDKQHPTPISTATYPNVGFTHQGWFTEDQRYFFLDDEHDDGAGGDDRTRTVGLDLSKLDDPVVLTEFRGMTHATDHNLYIRGHLMYQSNYAAGLRIIDITDPKHPKEVGYLDTAPDLENGPGMNLGSWGNYPYLKNGVVAVASKGLYLVRYKPD